MDQNVKDDHSGPTPGETVPLDAAVLVFAEDAAAGASLTKLVSERIGCHVHEMSELGEAMEVYSTVRVHLVILAVSDRERGIDQLRSFMDAAHGRWIPILVSVCGERGGDHLDFLREGADDAVPFLCPEPEIVARAQRLLAHESRREGLRMSRQYTLAGDLSRAGFADLITLLEHGRLTGSLELLTLRGPAQVVVRDGQVTHASFANLGGRVAFFELLRERQGQFEFVPDDTVEGDSRCAVEGPNASLLLEGSRVNDENPYRMVTITGAQDRTETETVTRALPPDRELAEMWLGVVRNPETRGEIRLLARDRVREWTERDLDGSRLRIALVTDVACGVHVISQLAAPIAEKELAEALHHAPSAMGLTWRGPHRQALEVLLLDQQRLGGIADSVRCSPAVLILAPSYGDFLTYNVTARTVLQRLIQRVAPLLILGVGNAALENQLGSFAKLARISQPLDFLRGSLWKLGITPRALLEEAIRRWGDLPAKPGTQAA